MESAVSFAPLRPADFVNCAGRGGARPTFCGAGQPFFPRGGASIPDAIASKNWQIIDGLKDISGPRRAVCLKRQGGILEAAPGCKQANANDALLLPACI